MAKGVKMNETDRTDAADRGSVLSAGLAVAEKATKVCTRCGEVKPLADYYKDNRSTDGLDYMCKFCRRQQVKSYRDANHTKIAARKRLDEKSPAGRARVARYRNSDKARATQRAAEKARRVSLSDDYVKRCLLGSNRTVSAHAIPPELVELKRQQMETSRLARQLKEATRESSKDTDRFSGQHGRGGNAGRPATDRGE